ncbi:MAG: hypothetical protein ABJN57_08185 [Hyphomicrobiales bacterium]
MKNKVIKNIGVKQETLYGLGTLSLVAGLLLIGLVSLSIQTDAIAKDESRVSLDQTEAHFSQRYHSKILLSGSAYNHSLLNRDCVLVDELICQNLSKNIR